MSQDAPDTAIPATTKVLMIASGKGGVGKEDSALMWPPGTGDVQMGLAKMLPRAEMVVITTPALNAQKVGARVVDMGRKNYLRIVGVIENMTEFIVPDGSAHRLFGAGGGQQLTADVGAPLLGRVPIESVISGGGDIGEPAGCSARMLDAAMAALDALDAESIA